MAFVNFLKTDCRCLSEIICIPKIKSACFWEVVQVITEAVAQRCSVEKVFLEISQNSQENTCARVSFLIKLQAGGSGAGVFLWIL